VSPAPSSLRPLPVPKVSGAPRAVLGLMRLSFQTAGRIAPQVMAAWARNMYFTPRRYPPSRKERTTLARATPFDVEFPGGQRTRYPGGPLRAWSMGEGPVVLLCHGWESRGSRLAAAFAEPLNRAGFRAVWFDMPGHGDSPGTQSDVEAFSDAIGSVGKAVGPLHAIIAHSLGAASTTIAVTRGLETGRLAYLAPACWMVNFPERFADVFALPPSTRAAFRARLFQSFPEHLWTDLAGDVLSSKLTVPGLVIHDIEDGETHYEGAVAIHNAWSGSELMTTEGLGHRRIVSDPKVQARVLQFVQAS